MNQNAALGMLIAGLGTFALGFGLELTTAHSWGEVASPAFVGKALVQIGGVIGAVYGAKQLRPKE